MSRLYKLEKVRYIDARNAQVDTKLNLFTTVAHFSRSPRLQLQPRHKGQWWMQFLIPRFKEL
jgi:hypothetical protein